MCWWWLHYRWQERRNHCMQISSSILPACFCQKTDAGSIYFFNHLLPFSIFPCHNKCRGWSFTLITLNLTPGISPFERPCFPPILSIRTSSCSSMNLCARFPGINAVTDFPFFVSWTLQHFLIAEFGWLASFCTFSRTIPLACGFPSNGSAFSFKFNAVLMNHLLCHLASFLFVWFWICFEQVCSAA